MVTNKNFIAAVFLASLFIAPMQAMQRRNPDDSCWDRVKKVVVLSLLGAVVLSNRAPQLCLPEDSIGGRCSCKDTAFRDERGWIKIDGRCLYQEGPKPVKQPHEDSNEYLSFHGGGASVYDIQ